MAKSNTAERDKKILIGVGICVVIGIGLAINNYTGKGPSVSIRGKPASLACKRAKKNFDLCMERAGKSGLKACTSEFVERKDFCE